MEPICQISFTGMPAINLDPLRQSIQSNPCAFRHPHLAEEAYLITPHPNTARLVEPDLTRNPYAGTGGSALLKIFPQSLWLQLDMAADLSLQQLALLLLPLLRQREFTVFTDTGVDVTSRYRDKPEDLFR